jgi:hypothetical protein
MRLRSSHLLIIAVSAAVLTVQSTYVSAQGRLPACPRTKDAKTWTNCVGEFQTSRHEKYVGEFRNGKPNGQGTLTMTAGTKYVGELKDGLPNGQGILTFVSGPFASQKYVGGWRGGRFHGQGIEYGADGKVRSGRWENGVFVGQ